MQAYVISLHAASAPHNAALAARLEACGMTPAFISATQGSALPLLDYYERILTFQHQRGIILSPSELGCSLSHRAACEAVLASGLPGAFVFEDDIDIPEASAPVFERIAALGASGCDFIHLGGMDGLEDDFMALRGDIIEKTPLVFELDPEDLHALMRTAGYWVSRDMAARLARLHQDHAFLADDFVYLREHLPLQRVCFCNLIRHPVDTAASSIEHERKLRLRHVRERTAPNYSPVLKDILALLGRRLKARLANRRKQREHHRLVSQQLKALGASPPRDGDAARTAHNGQIR